MTICTSSFTSHDGPARFAYSKDGADPSDAVPVSFRYSVAPLASMKTFVFKPGQADTDGGSEPVRAACLGAFYSGNFQKVVRDKRATLVWEARQCNDQFRSRFHHCQQMSLVLIFSRKGNHILHPCQVDFTKSPPKVQIVKPKIYLTASLEIPAKKAVKLSS